MKNNCIEKTWSFIVCLLLAASSLTACGTDPDTAAITTAAVSASGTSTSATSETTTTSAATETATTSEITSAAVSSETSAALSTTVASSVTTSVSTALTTTAVFAASSALTAGDLTDARAVLEQFMQAVEKRDEETAMRLSNLGVMKNVMLEMAKQQQGEQAEQLKKQAEQLFLYNYYPQFGHFNGGYTIDDGIDAQAYADAFNKSQKEVNEEITQIMEEAREKQPELADVYKSLFQQLMEPIQKLCVFTVKSNQNDASQEMYLRLTDNGWQIDVLSFDMFRYVAKSKLSSANSAARQLFRALNSSLVDMDTEDLSINKLAGTHTYKGADLANLDKNAKNGMDYLLKKVLMYYADIEKAEEFSFVIDKTGNCTATAVKMNGTIIDVRAGELGVFGAYPKPISTDDAEKYQSLQDALAYAEAGQQTTAQSSK